MADAVLDRPRVRGGGKRPPLPWWGKGAAPHERWPGVSLDFKPTWSSLRNRWETHAGAYYFDPEKAARACDFFPTFLRHHIGEFTGQPFVLRADQALLIVRPMFGWRRVTDGMRRFRKVFAFCPKGWGKSPLGAGLGIYLARCDGEAAAEVYAVAGDREQARIVHGNAKIMVENSPALLDGCEIVKNAITWPELYASYTVLSSDASTKHGFRPHGIIFDELHAQRNRDLFEALRKSMAKRIQPLLIIITHAGTDDESICFEEYELAKRVLMDDSTEVDTTLPVIFEAQAGDDWTSPDLWRRVNPGHGITVQHDAIVEECQEARAEPRKQNDFLRYHLNRWTNQATAWIPVDWWDACEEPLPSDEELARYPCAVGIDMAQKIDLAAAVTVWRLPLKDRSDDSIEVISVDEAGGVKKRRVSLNYRIAVRCQFWLPEDTLKERVHQDRVPYDIYHRDELLDVTDGPIIDSDAIVQHVLARAEAFKLLKQGEVGYDPAFATEVALRLRPKMNVVEVRQNYTMLSEPCQIFEALIKAKRVLHGGNRLLRWNLENVAIKTDDAGRIHPVKPKKAAKRIDGIVATIIALSRIMVMPEPKKQIRVVGEL